MHNLCSVYYVSQPLYVLGLSVAHHQDVYCIYATIGTCCAEKGVFLKLPKRMYISL